MSRSACLLAPVFVLVSQSAGWCQDRPPAAGKKVPAGVYAVQRDSVKKKDVLPLKDGEVLVVNHYRYEKKGDDQPPRYVVVRSVPEVALELASEPKAEKEGKEVVRILLKLKPKAASALERLTREQRGKAIAIVLGGEVVTMHKVREAIKGGEVQITSCAAGAAGYLLKELEGYYRKK
jgi:preprotein translocase subunit SecD